MFKHLLFLATAFLTAASGISQNMVYDDFSDYPITIYGEQTTIIGEFSGVSPNGKWAVGMDATYTKTSWLFNVEEGQLEFVHDGSATSVPATARGVADDGTVVGSYYDAEQGRCFPGYRTYSDGVWHELPLPEDTKLNYTSLSQLFNLDYGDYNPTALRITPDGSTIAGTLRYNSIKGYEHPIVWHRNAAGEWEIEEFPEVDCSKYGGFLLYGISADGTTLIGSLADEYERSNGTGYSTKFPVIIKDGKAVTIWSEYDDNHVGVGYPPFGTAFNMDADGNVYGYYYDKEQTINGFVWNEAEGMKHISKGNAYNFGLNENMMFSAENNGFSGTAYLCTPDNRASVQELFNLPGESPDIINSASADGRVLAGAFSQFTDYGEVMYYPWICVLEESPITGISSPKQSLTRNGMRLNPDGTLRVEGDYSKAEVFNAAGARVAESNAKGNTISLGARMHGTYMVRITDLNGNTRTVKVLK